jgi:hypothetical protein
MYLTIDWSCLNKECRGKNLDEKARKLHERKENCKLRVYRDSYSSPDITEVTKGMPDNRHK